MSIVSFIKKVCVQTAVYWEYTGTDAYSTPQFASPVEISTRWDEKTEIISDSNGKEYISNAQLLVPQDLTEQSYVWLGALADLPADPDPLNTEDAFEIKKMDRYPLFRSKTFDVFIGYL